ncbi:hypothetical protein H310_14704 [Aphanomyces invadans]|uniref:Uncharacterized protein n=1 Tax=Aphanomyces invadans TaxID=157072 RepID=A0A024T954_9STRA|nr:hypothetical protein H310_14704 [Aphanomyces invadans]ETV90514.1 hypothetical protein H310_14704 [Aphanomyces invadans]|eukprot:XP_008880830.1 hypothetical protein H310_14704 [Aphanomyces invadans]
MRKNRSPFLLHLDIDGAAITKCHHECIPRVVRDASMIDNVPRLDLEGVDRTALVAFMQIITPRKLTIGIVALDRLPYVSNRNRPSDSNDLELLVRVTVIARLILAHSILALGKIPRLHAELVASHEFVVYIRSKLSLRDRRGLHWCDHVDWSTVHSNWRRCRGRDWQWWKPRGW